MTSSCVLGYQDCRLLSALLFLISASHSAATTDKITAVKKHLHTRTPHNGRGGVRQLRYNRIKHGQLDDLFYGSNEHQN